jgi:hypothetical protein
MRQGIGAASLVLLVIGEAGAGELMLANGSRLDGELTNASAVDGRALGRGVQLEVIADDAPLRRDAIAAADPVGRVSRGQRVTYVDTIDRRLRMFNVLLFDGGHWVRVRAADGSEGWLPAGTVRETR